MDSDNASDLTDGKPTDDKPTGDGFHRRRFLSTAAVTLGGGAFATSTASAGPGMIHTESFDNNDWTLSWRDEFDTIDTSIWNFETGNNNGWGNNELEYYRANNAWTENGHLVIEAREEQYGGCDYTSARMTTQGKYNKQYGRVDVRAKLPYGQGIWPAIWMLGSNIGSVGWPDCGEIDIMELIGSTPTPSTEPSTVPTPAVPVSAVPTARAIGSRTPTTRSR